MYKETPKDMETQGYYCASILNIALKRTGDLLMQVTIRIVTQNASDHWTMACLISIVKIPSCPVIFLLILESRPMVSRWYQET